MTVTRDQRSDLDDDDYSDDVAWNDRALFGSFKGLPWWAAVLIAFVLAIIGTYVDVSSTKTVGWIFSVLFFLGAVGAVVFVERRSMFGPIVQPPLVLAIVVPLVVVVAEGLPASGGLSGLALTLGKPLINGFPTMAVTTVFTVVIGLFRVFRQRDPNRPTKDEVREAKADRKASKAARERPSRPVAKPDDDRPSRPRERDADSGARRRPVADERRPRPAQQGERRRPAAGAAGASGERAAPRQQPRGDRPIPPRRPRPRDED